MYEHRTIYSLTILIVFSAVIIIVMLHGHGNRLFASEEVSITIDSPEKAFMIWKEKNVKGRVLLLFDRYPHMRGLRSYNGSPRLTGSNFIEYAIFMNIIRKIYFIVPDDVWEVFRLQETMHPIREVPGLERGLFLYTLSGIPFIATTPSSMPQLSEKALVLINDTAYDREEALTLLSEKEIGSDIIITHQDRGK